MELIHQLLDFIAHIDVYLQSWVTEYDRLTYLFLAIIIFCETGLVFTPFLPGDSLLFAAGALAGAGMLNLGLIFIVLFAAALAGDNSNYFIGSFIGHKIIAAKRTLIKKEYLERTHAFYEKHGGKAIILAPLRSNYPHVCTVCCRTWHNDLSKVYSLLCCGQCPLDLRILFSRLRLR